MISCYIHIPFCNNICSYCDFCKMYYNEELVDKYLDKLEEEIKSLYKNEEIYTLYIGGGTPSSLNINQLNRLFDIIKILNLSKLKEFTFECNFDSINEEKLKLLKSNHVDRLSFGVETFNERLFDLINRKSNYIDVKNKIKLCRKYGFNNINLDLMYGFNTETIDELKEDLEKIISLNVEHISTYSLILEEHTKLFLSNYKEIDSEIDSKMYYFIIDYLKEHDFSHYEISNFSKDGYNSKHNLVYWNNSKYYGFGLGASGYIDNYRYNNTRSINKYLNNEFVLDKEEMNNSINMENEMILGLRKTNGVNKIDFYKKYGLNIYDKFDIIDLVNNNMLIDDGDNIFINENNLYISNSILVKFIGGSNE